MKTWIVLTLGLLWLALVNCGTNNTRMDQDIEEIRGIFRQDKTEIIKKYNASGAGIGKRDGIYVIVVYADPASLKPPLDTHWKDIPLVFEDIGEVRAQ